MMIQEYSLRWIGRGGPIPWSARSQMDSNLTPFKEYIMFPVTRIKDEA